MFKEWLISLGNFFVPSTFLGLGASFLAGVLASFSPCILPLIPITLGIVGAVSASTRLRGFLVSLIFVSGVAVVYTALGITSTLFGILWGKFFINPVTYLVLAIVFFILSASAFGLIRLNLPVSTGSTYRAGKSLISIFILGMISAFALIPCNFPVFGAILSLIAVKGNILYGGLALFLFAFGHGMLLIILGTSTSLIQRLPKQSLGFIIIHKCIGLILATLGVYFAVRFISLLG